MNLKANDVLNQRYRILRVLSDKGGMGLIYQAHDHSLNQTVVIKQSRFAEQFLRKAFEREAKLLCGLRHNALPRVAEYEEGNLR